MVNMTAFLAMKDGNITHTSTDSYSVNWSPTDCDLPDGECDIVRTEKKVILGLTITVILSTIVCIIILGKYKTFLERIICHLLAANLLSAVFIIDSDGRPEEYGTPLCIAQAFFIQLFDFAECIWCCSFTIFLFLIMVKGMDTSCYERYYTVGAWGISFIVACLPFITEGAYGPASAPFCWIVAQYSTTWRFAVYWIPVFILLVLMLIAFIYMIIRTKRQLSRYRTGEDPQVDINHQTQMLVDQYLKPLTAYFALFFIIQMIQLANRIQNEISPPVFILVVLHMASISSHGILLCLLFFALGKKDLTRDKFKRGFDDITRKIKRCGTIGNPRGDGGVFSATTVVPKDMDKQKRESGMGSVNRGLSVDENTDSGIA